MVHEILSAEKRSVSSSELNKSVTEKTLKSIKWSALMHVVSKTASPTIFVILSLLLTPEDFGILATASIAIAFFQIFNDAGLNKALVQTKLDISKSANVVFWVSIALGLILYILLFFTAENIANFYESPKTKPVLQVLSLQIIIGSIATVQRGLFIKEFEFKKLFWVKLSTAFIPGVISIPLAFFGYGVWALVFGSLAGQLLDLILLWKYSPWKPSFEFDYKIALLLAAFGIWALFESFLIWFIRWGDSLILGKFLGIEELGVYRVGLMLVKIVFGFLLNPLIVIFFPTFSKFQDEPELALAFYKKALKAISLIAIPLGLGFLIIGSNGANLVFNDRWVNLGYVVSIIGFTFGISKLVGFTSELYRGIGKPNINVYILLITVSISVPAYIYFSKMGLIAFTNTRFVLAIIGVIIHFYFINKILDFNPLGFAKIIVNTILASIPLVITLLVFNSTLLELQVSRPIMFVFTFLTIITAVGVYFLSFYKIDKPFIQSMYKALLKIKN